MKSLKAKYIIQIITFMLIFGDAYSECSTNLYNAGYFFYDHSLIIHDLEKRMMDYTEIEFSTINFTEQYYALYLILKINQTEIKNADDWCSCNAVKTFKEEEDKKPTETTDNPEAVEIKIPTETIVNEKKHESPDSPTISATKKKKHESPDSPTISATKKKKHESPDSPTISATKIGDTKHETPTKPIDNPEIVLTSVDELPKETIVKIEDTKHETPTKSTDNPEIVLTSVDELPDETIVKMCVDELKKRGYIYKKGLINYAFSKKEPLLLKPYTDYLRKESKNKTENTDDKQNISSDETQSISTDKQQSISTDEATSTKLPHLEIAEKLYLNRWCIKYASSMIGYSDERKRRLERVFNGRADDLYWQLHRSCVGVLIADGFIQKNAEESYAFIEIKTYFLTPYNEYLDKEAEKLTKNFDGLTKWCQNKNRLSELETLLINTKSSTEHLDN